MREDEIYQLEKSVWTEADFSVMGWHDCRIHGTAAAVLDEDEPWRNELYFDLDYVFRWVDPQPPDPFYTFWVAPCTLIFKNYFDLKIDAFFEYVNSFEIDGVNMLGRFENEYNHLLYYHWEIELRGGVISLKSEGFEQIVRKPPIHTPAQSLTLDERGGLSFDKTPC